MPDLRLVSLVQLLCLIAITQAPTPPQSPPAPTPAPLVLSLSRSVCYGTCPEYVATLYEDGTLSYEGKRFVKVTGARTKTLDADTVARVKRALSDPTFTALPPHCCDCYEWTDNPTTTITFMFEGTRRVVEHYHGCRQEKLAWLSKFENTLDDLLGTAEFVTKR
jgi:Domain of unknown function (DUF6438)